MKFAISTVCCSMTAGLWPPEADQKVCLLSIRVKCSVEELYKGMWISSDFAVRHFEHAPMACDQSIASPPLENRFSSHLLLQTTCMRLASPCTMPLGAAARVNCRLSFTNCAVTRIWWRHRGCHLGTSCHKLSTPGMHQPQPKAKEQSQGTGARWGDSEQQGQPCTSLTCPQSYVT